LVADAPEAHRGAGHHVARIVQEGCQVLFLLVRRASPCLIVGAGDFIARGPDSLGPAHLPGKQYIEVRKKFVAEGLLPAVAAVRARNTQLATELLHGTMETLFEPARTDINQLIQLQEDVARQEFEARQKAYVLVRNSCIAALVFGLILAAVIGYWLVRAITRPLNQAIELANGTASGDLTQSFPAPSKDEMGKLLRALQNMNDSLVTIVSQVRTGTGTIATASSQIAAGNQDLSSRTEEQASSLVVTASSMEELTSTAKQNADDANQANTLAVTASGFPGADGWHRADQPGHHADGSGDSAERLPGGRSRRCVRVDAERGSKTG
jgi:methyl-accepting chemotaxis protein